MKTLPGMRGAAELNLSAPENQSAEQLKTSPWVSRAASHRGARLKQSLGPERTQIETALEGKNTQTCQALPDHWNQQYAADKSAFSYIMTQ
jgi:hypothetical protein